MDIQHQIPLFAGNVPSGGCVYTVPDGTTYRITEIRYRNQGAADVVFQMGVNGFEPESLLVDPVSLAPGTGTAYRTYKESLWLGAGGSIFVGGGANVYVEVYGIIANVLSALYDKNGAFIGMRMRETTPIESTQEGEVHVADRESISVLKEILKELTRARMGIEELTGVEIDDAPEEDTDDS